MSVMSDDDQGFDGALMSTASPQLWFDAVFVPEIARQLNPQHPYEGSPELPNR
jgi:hypothetical protein